MKKSITRIPLKIISIENDGYHLMIPARINRKKAKLLIDTGASRTVFDKTRIMKFLGEEDLEFEQNEKLSTGLGTNTLASEVIVLSGFKLGDHRIKYYQAVVLDMKHVNESYTKLKLPEIDGVIGGDILKKYNAALYYKEKILKLYY